MKRLVFILSFFLPTLLYAQSSVMTGNSFPNGVYLQAADLKSRTPSLLSSQILIHGEISSHIKKWFRGDSLFYLDQQKACFIYYDSVFAFVDEGVLYIQRKGFDHKVTVPGPLCYFVESYPIRRTASAPVVMDRKNEAIPRILDIQTGEIIAYSVPVLAEILAERDEALYQEFVSINNPKKQRQLLLRYVERYNERHPLTSVSQ